MVCTLLQVCGLPTCDFLLNLFVLPVQHNHRYEQHLLYSNLCFIEPITMNVEPNPTALGDPSSSRQLGPLVIPGLTGYPWEPLDGRLAWLGSAGTCWELLGCDSQGGSTLGTWLVILALPEEPPDTAGRALLCASRSAPLVTHAGTSNLTSYAQQVAQCVREVRSGHGRSADAAWRDRNSVCQAPLVRERARHWN